MGEKPENKPSQTAAELEAIKLRRNRVVPGFLETLELHWRPQWKALGLSTVVMQVMAGRGPAVEDSTWGVGKGMEASVWVREESARLADVERTTIGRAKMGFWLSILAVCVSLASLVITAGGLL